MTNEEEVANVKWIKKDDFLRAEKKKKRLKNRTILVSLHKHSK